MKKLLVAGVILMSCACATQNSNDYFIKISKSDKVWHLDAGTGDNADKVKVDFSFLDSGVVYEVAQYSQDGVAVKPDTVYVSKTDLKDYCIGRNSKLTMELRMLRDIAGDDVNIVRPILPDSVKVTDPDHNPFREALLPLPESAIFKMEGYGLWDPSIIKVDGVYHLFCSRWVLATQVWKQSEVIRAISKSLFGPYTFQEVVISPTTHPWATQGVHNPKIMKVDDRYLLYYQGIPVWSTGFAYADNIEGPWEIVEEPVLKSANTAIVRHNDGSVYAIGKFKPKGVPVNDGLCDMYMRAFTASDIDGTYTIVKDEGNRLPNNFEYEDPTLFYKNGKYYVICTDWEAKATGVQKALIYYTSTDGVNYELYSQIPIWDQSDPIPMEGGGYTKITQIERPQVYFNEDGEIEALAVGVISSRDEVDGTVPNNHIMIRPVGKIDF